jgi:hypothetical protein
MQLVDTFTRHNVITLYGRGAGGQSCFLKACVPPFRVRPCPHAFSGKGIRLCFTWGRFGRRRHGAVLTLNCIDIEALTMVKITIR